MPSTPKISIEQLVTSIRGVDKRALQREEATLAAALQTVHQLLRSTGSEPEWTLQVGGGAISRGAATSVRRTSFNSAPTASVSKPKARTRKKARGGGWEAVQASLKKSRGKGTTASLKAMWARHGSATPLSVAMAGFVKSGRLKRKGKGRDTVFMLA